MAALRDNFRDSAILLGYARVSTDDQDLTLQRRALREAGCRRLYEESRSGVRRDRPELARLLDAVREGDVVVVTGRTAPAARPRRGRGGGRARPYIAFPFRCSPDPRTGSFQRPTRSR